MAASPTRIITNDPNHTLDFDKSREAVCEAVPIETYARKHTPVESFGGGGWFNGPCTLRNHRDEDKPFYISPAGTWRCEACDQGSDVVDVAMLCGGYDSPEAAMLALAVEYGVELPHESNGHVPGFSSAEVVPDGSELLRGLAEYVLHYVVLTDEQADLIALWIVHTHALDAADTTPYLEVVSAEKRSGKTRLLEVLSTIAAKPWFTRRVTVAVLVRKVADLMPTLLLDESDAAFKGDKEYSEALRGILNSGFRRGGVASLCVGQGANLAYADFPVFSPKVIAGIGKLPDTISDRAIKIELRRRARSEPVERFRLRKVAPEAETLKAEVAAWAEAHIARLRDLEPELPDELDDRAQDICEPLLAIAVVVGGEWPERARKALITLAGAATREDSESLGIRLLRDIRSAFGDAQRLHTTTILEELGKDDSAPWAQLGGDGLDARGLARLLKTYRIRSKQVRIYEDNRKGYEREDFEDAWERYCPAPDSLSETAKLPAIRAEKTVSDVSSGEPKRNRENPHGNANVSDVSDRPGGGEPSGGVHINDQGEAEF